jgi:hypothetical protein
MTLQGKGVGTEDQFIRSMASKLRAGEPPAYILMLIRTWVYLNG